MKTFKSHKGIKLPYFSCKVLIKFQKPAKPEEKKPVLTYISLRRKYLKIGQLQGIIVKISDVQN